MKLEASERAFLDGCVLPQYSPGVVIALDSSRLAQRDGVILLRSLIAELRRMHRECVSLSSAGYAVVPVLDAVPQALVVKAIAVDPRGRRPPLQGLEPDTAASRPEQPDGSKASQPDDTVAKEECSATDTERRPNRPQMREADSDHERVVDEALRLALALRTSYAKGALQEFKEMDEAITRSPLPELTRRYVARTGSHRVVIKSGMLDWGAAPAITDPLPEAQAAGIDALVCAVEEDRKTARVQVLQLHRSSGQYKDALSPISVDLRPRVIDVVVPQARHREWLAMAMPRGWRMRLALSVSRLLLKPNEPLFTLLSGHIFTPSAKECKNELGIAIDVAGAEPRQLAIWSEID